ncbi:hypothetical protein OHA10_24460 [Kribbella sp. NBC_00662]|uniref:hypothetical protein n=1 Tax=Kribbella sp. NBC_00662 TaxID=2975969 RepID=UPI003250DBB3
MASRKRRDKSGGPGEPTTGKHADQPGQDGPERPESWRDLVRTDYEYPSDFDELGRRERRRAKKDWRREDQGQRMAWLRDQRRAEPVSPLSVLVIVLLLAVIILGLGGGLPKILGRGEPKEQPIGLLTPAGPLPLPTGAESASPAPSSVPQPADTTPPPVTVRPNPTATLSADDVVGKWARQFYTRNPANRAYADFVNDAAQYMTDDLAAGFIAQGDSTYEALKAQKGTSKVVSANVAAPKPGTAPVDTPGRISRSLTVVIDISGTKPARITVPLMITLVMQEGSWVISDVDGGTGP